MDNNFKFSSEGKSERKNKKGNKFKKLVCTTFEFIVYITNKYHVFMGLKLLPINSKYDFKTLDIKYSNYLKSFNVFKNNA